YALHQVAVDVAVVVGEAGGGEVVGAADAVVEVVVEVGARHFVVADHVVAAAEVEAHALRAGRMRRVPAVRAVARIVDLVPLHGDALQRQDPFAAHAGVVVHAIVPAAGRAI